MNILRPEQYPALPKWPAAFVTGSPVTVEQAKEINFRTDCNLGSVSGYGFGNDQEFRAKCIKDFGWTKVVEMQKDPRASTLEEGFSPWTASANWAAEMKRVNTEYVVNDWLSSSYVGGPHGWCQPDGTILSEGHNYGKWPNVEDVMRDWAELLKAFPYLNLVCTLFSGESCEEDAVPVVTIVVRDEQVIAVQPDLSLHSKPYTRPTEERVDALMAAIVKMNHNDFSYERGWPDGWLEEFAERSRSAMKKAARRPRINK